MLVSWVSIVVHAVVLLQIHLLRGTCSASDAASETIKTASDALLAMGSFVSESNLGNRIEKRRFSDAARLLFIVGLEGTGHHGWRAMITECVSRGFCVPERALTSLLMRQDGETATMHGIFGADEGAESELVPDFAAAFRHMQQLAQRATTAPPQLYFLGLESVTVRERMSGMMSYPNFDGPLKPLNNPDVHVLAALAEAAGVDCRLLVLQRNPAAVYRSDIDHHAYGHAREPRVLQVAAEEIKAQLSLLDRRFFACSDFEELDSLDEAQSDALMHFLHPQLRPIWKPMLAHFRAPDATTTATTTATSLSAAAVGNHSIQREIAKDVAASEIFSRRGEIDAALLLLARSLQIYQLHLRMGLIADECARTV